MLEVYWTDSKGTAELSQSECLGVCSFDSDYNVVIVLNVDYLCNRPFIEAYVLFHESIHALIYSVARHLWIPINRFKRFNALIDSLSNIVFDALLSIYFVRTQQGTI